MNDAKNFPSDWYPYGATLVSTMTRWAHPGQTLAEWTKEAQDDLQRMADGGMTAVGLMLDWELVEPQEDHFDFGRFDPMMEKAAELGLKVVLWPWEQVEPEWVARNHPDWCWVADDGLKPPYGSWHHPEFRRRVHRFVGNAVERYRDSSAMLMWNIAIEPHYRVAWFSRTFPEHETKTGFRLFCFNPATLAKFREWLKERHQNSLEALNRRWLTYYTNWSEVEPPRFSYNNFNSPRFFDWKMFWVWSLMEYQHQKHDLVKSLDPVHPTTGNSGFSTDPMYAGLGASKIASKLDSFGISYFPIYRSGRNSQEDTNLQFDYIQSLCAPEKPAFVHELQGGPQVSGTVFGESPDPEEIRQWSWYAVAKGYRGIFFWAWRPHQTGTEAAGFGLCELDGSDTPRTKVAGEVSRQLQKIAPLLNRLRPPAPKVGILYSDLNLIFQAGAGILVQDPVISNLVATGVRCYFEVLNALHLPVHFVHEEDIHQLIDGRYSELDALFVPYLPLADDRILETLEQFARRGKMLWSDPWLGQRTDANVCRPQVPSDRLQKIFGCRQGQVRPIIPDNEINRKNVWRGNSVLGQGTCRVEMPGREPQSLLSMVHEVALIPQAGARVVGQFADGHPAIVEHRQGNSAAYYTGSYFASAIHQEFKPIGFEEQAGGYGKADTGTPSSKPAVMSVLQSILAERGIEPPIRAVGADRPEIEANVLVGPGEAVAIFLNIGPDPVAGKWRIKPELSVGPKTRAIDLLTQQPIEVTPASADSVEVQISLPRYGVAVVHLNE